MSQPFIGEIKVFPYPRGAPNGWQLCDGSLLSIAEYETLYTLIGTVYGGDGVQTFAVPDLRGSVPIHQGQGRGLSSYALGQKSGTEQVTLTSQQMPAHSHFLAASQVLATSMTAAGQVLAQAPAGSGMYLDTTAGATQSQMGNVVQPSGGNVAHENCMPTLTLNPCIATFGVFPSRN